MMHRYNISYVSPEQAAAGAHDRPGISHYCDTIEQVIAFVDRIGWEQVCFITDAEVHEEEIDRYDRRYRGIEGTLSTRRNIETIYQAPVFALRAAREKEMQQRVEMAHRHNYYVSFTAEPLIDGLGFAIADSAAVVSNAKVIEIDNGQFTWEDKTGASGSAYSAQVTQLTATLSPVHAEEGALA